MKLKMRQFTYMLLAINALAFSGCNMINPNEEIPAYIHVSKYAFTANESTEGTSSNKITDVWISAGNTFLGGFEMPTTIPVLEKGRKLVTIAAGVKENGIAATRKPYPFYEPYAIDIELIDAHIDTLIPEWKYKKETEFRNLENFEGTNISFELSNNRSTTQFRITNQPDSAFEGNSALAANVDPNHNFFECQTKEPYQLPRGHAVWLEMNYKTEVPVEIGLLSLGSAGNSRVFGAGINPSANWNKIYINLTEAVVNQPLSQDFKIYLAAFSSGNGGKILVDNIKLLYLE